jgi:nicotinamide riboside kinase
VFLRNSCAPPTLALHEAIGRQLAGLLLEECPAGVTQGLALATRTRWMGEVHTGIDIVGHGNATIQGRSAARVAEADAESTLVRLDPIRHWSLLHPVVQRDLTIRVCVVGAESTGKTTLVRALSGKHKTKGVEEFGRAYTLDKKAAGTNDTWTTDDFVMIASEQQRLEDAAALGAGPLFFCDTDAMTTALWHERYQGAVSAAVEHLGNTRTYDLFVLCDTDFPWQQDEIRLGADTRTVMHDRFLQELNIRTEPWVLVTGSVDERIVQVEAALEQHSLLRAEYIFRPTRHHLRR